MRFPAVQQSFQFANLEVMLYGPERAAVRTAYESGEISFPYWSQVWPAAIALADFLAANSSYTANKQVLEIGAGLGLPSLVAARYAASVLCTDYNDDALEYVQHSAALAGLKNLRTAVLDWQALPAEITCDVVLLSDANYEPQAFETLQNVVQSFLQKGTTILLSTPQRLMAKGFIAPMLPHCKMQNEQAVFHHGKAVNITVLVLKATMSITQAPH